MLDRDDIIRVIWSGDCLGEFYRSGCLDGISGIILIDRSSNIFSNFDEQSMSIL